MASSPDLPNAALFSPSKARAHQAQARDWAAVDAWLARKYNPTTSPSSTTTAGANNNNGLVPSTPPTPLAPTIPPPPARTPLFERTDETLAALLALATLNDAADDLRAHVERVQGAALAGLSKAVSGTVGAEVVPAVLAEMEGSEGAEALRGLSEASVAMDVRGGDVLGLGRAVVELGAREWELRMLVERAGRQVEAMKREQGRMREALRGLEGERWEVRSGTVGETGEWVKSTRQLKAKVAEYDEKLAATAGKASGEVEGELQALREKVAVVAEQKRRLATLEAQLSAFQDMPAEPKAARVRLNEARAELQALVEKRDALFERMV